MEPSPLRLLEVSLVRPRRPLLPRLEVSLAPLLLLLRQAACLGNSSHARVCIVEVRETDVGGPSYASSAPSAPASSTTTPSLFGAPSAAPASTSLFGSKPSTPAPAGGGPFGAPAAYVSSASCSPPTPVSETHDSRIYPAQVDNSRSCTCPQYVRQARRTDCRSQLVRRQTCRSCPSSWRRSFRRSRSCPSSRRRTVWCEAC